VPADERRASVNDRRAAVSLAGLAGNLQTVRSALGDDAAGVRAAAIQALARAGDLSADEAAAALADPDPVVRRCICELASTIGPADFVPLLTDEDPTVVEAAAFACGEQEIAASIDGLVEVAGTHSDPLCREAAVAAIGVLGALKGLPALLKATTDVAAVRRRAIIALSNYEGDEVTGALNTALGDRDWQVRQAAEDVLGVNRTPTR
jgi:HEAT repeat protein